MRVLVLIASILTLASCMTQNLQCGEQSCSASLEQHPGQTDWYIVIDSEYGMVQAADGRKLPVSNYERWVGNGDVELRPGSCRVCTRKKK
jgi:hypothetical protein